jgi:acylphosphatase
MVIRHVMIRGQVQRVGYRAWAEGAAAGFGLEGWVRNRIDGAVEAVFAGPAEAVAKMIEACRKGPSAARVETIDEREGTLDDLALRHSGERFSVLGTA